MSTLLEGLLESLVGWWNLLHLLWLQGKEPGDGGGGKGLEQATTSTSWLMTHCQTIRVESKTNILSVLIEEDWYCHLFIRQKI